MPVSHARVTPVTSTDDSGKSLACWRCWRRSRTRAEAGAAAIGLVFVLAVAVACVLAGAKTFREIGDQAADLPQDVLRGLGGAAAPAARQDHRRRARSGSGPCSRRINADVLDEIIGSWLRALADAGKLEGLLTAIAIDGKWLRGVADGQVKLFAAMLQRGKAS